MLSVNGDVFFSSECWVKLDYFFVRFLGSSIDAMHKMLESFTDGLHKMPENR